MNPSQRRFWLWMAGIVLLAPIALLIIFFIGIFCTQTGYALMGYHTFVYNGEKIARIAQDTGNPKECDKIRVVYAMNTNTYLERQYCIYTYAKLTHDPSACELLMPGEYGWSCLGTIEGQLFSGRLCTRSGALDHVIVYCNRESEGELSIDRPQIEDCSRYKRNDLREWCYGARTELLKDIYDCHRITHDVVRDYCEYSYALKIRDPTHCSAVSDERRRDFCLEYVSLSVKYRGKGPIAK